jgi:hypothetical protein
MNSNGTTGPIPIRLQHANPLLFTLAQRDMTIQPYWIMILQILALQLIQRVWHLCRYQEFLLTLEIVFIRSFYKKQLKIMKNWAIRSIVVPLGDIQIIVQNQSDFPKHSFLSSQRKPTLTMIIYNRPFQQVFEKLEKKCNKMGKKLTFDLVDFFLNALPVFGHGIWYCYIQSSCMSAEDATLWNCYNAFGYRIYNYTFVSYCSFCYNFFMKIVVIIVGHDEKKSKSDIVTGLIFCFSVITFVFNGALILPYFITHALPMLFIYTFMSAIYFGVWVILFYLSLAHLSLLLPKLYKTDFLLSRFIKWIAIYPMLFIVSFGAYSYPILISTLFNYSQYLYYGEDYFQTMTDEYNSRDTTTYLNVLRNSINQKFHSALNFF